MALRRWLGLYSPLLTHSDCLTFFIISSLTFSFLYSPWLVLNVLSPPFAYGGLTQSLRFVLEDSLSIHGPWSNE